MMGCVVLVLFVGGGTVDHHDVVFNYSRHRGCALDGIAFAQAFGLLYGWKQEPAPSVVSCSPPQSLCFVLGPSCSLVSVLLGHF